MFFLTAPAAHAASPTLYERMRQITREQYLVDVDGAKSATARISRFAAAVQDLPEGKVQAAEIGSALNDDNDFCNKTPLRSELNVVRRCTDVRQGIQSLTQQIAAVDTLGYDLQIGASAYEQPVSGQALDDMNLPARARALVRIWQAGTGSTAGTATDLTLRVTALPESDGTKAKVAAVSGELMKLMHPTQAGNDMEEFIGAVWRYDVAGVRYVRNELPEFNHPEPPDAGGTERQYLTKHWTTLEDALKALWSDVDGITFDPPLKTREAALIRFPAAYQKMMPDNVLLWAYREKRAGGALSGDIGVAWQQPLAPVLPSLCKDGEVDDAGTCDPILGGSYPPPPRSGKGPLCAQPTARLGYLCRPLTEESDQICKQTTEPQEGKIVLAACTGGQKERETLAGPEACMDVQWHEPKAFDPQAQCKVELVCDDSSEFTGGFTKAKRSDGVIEVQVKSTTVDPATYVFLHEMTHAKQACGLPPGTLNYPEPLDKDAPDAEKDKALDGCCTMEGQAYQAECGAIAQDGGFTDANGKEIIATQGVPGMPINKETCWQILTDYSCKNRNYGSCPNTFIFDAAYPTGKGAAPTAAQQEYAANEKLFILETLKKSMDNRPSWMPADCQETLNPTAPGQKRDERIDATLNDLTRSDNVVTPKTVTTYANSIGDNVCYFVAAGKQSMEHRLTGGRAPFVAQDEAFPHDMCERPDPQFGSLQTLPAFTPWDLPPYRPGLLIKQIDQSLCAGLPPRMPPILCSYELALGSSEIRGSYNGVTSNVQDQREKRRVAMRDLEQLMPAIGARIGTQLYADYLSQRGRQLAGLAAAAAQLLGNFPKATFPKDMCPFNDAGGKNLLQTSACAAPSSSPAP